MAGQLTRSDVASSGGAFEGFKEADFRAYEPKKWSSNAFTLERRLAKDKLLALARAVRDGFETELADLELHATDEKPSVANGKKVDSQFAYFVRNAEGQAAIRALVNTTKLSAGASLFDISLHHQHASLWLKLDLAGLTVGLEIASKAKVDRDNAVEKLKQSWARERLIELCRALPAGTEVGTASAMVAFDAVNPPDVEAWLEALGTDASFSAQTKIASGEPRLASADAIALVHEQLALYLPLFRFLAWSRQNEHAHVKETIKKTVDEQKKKAIPFQPGDRVTILSGLFAGRGGYLAEIDAKGRAKVMVGPVSVTVEVKDLKAG
ncbi:MAG: hypothetical protein U1E65_08340 [Myxococcota bacterium]